MKRLCFILALLAISLMGYSQATSVQTIRVAATNVTFDVNLPVGSTIKCVADSTEYEVKAGGTASTRTIITALANGEIFLKTTTLEASAGRAATNFLLVKDSTKATRDTLSIWAATPDYAGVMTAADKTKLDGISASSGTMFAQDFENTTADSTSVTGSGYYTLTLTNTPKDTTSFTVSVNGDEVPHAAGGRYTVMVPDLAAKRVQLNIPVYKYDKIHVIYLK